MDLEMSTESWYSAKSLVSLQEAEDNQIFSNFTRETNLSVDHHLAHKDSEVIFDRIEVRVIFIVMYTIVFCSCFFGNLMVILVVTLHWRMRSITNFCLANLAFADFCVGIFCVYQTITRYLLNNWIFGNFLCKLYHFINTLSHTASILILVVICIERYLAILHPLQCKRMLTLTRLRVTIILVWIISAVYASPRLYYFRVVSMPFDDGDTICIPDRIKFNSKVADSVNLVFLFLMPLIIMSVLYTRIGIVLWRSSNTRMPAASASESTTSSCPECEEMNNTAIANNPTPPANGPHSILKKTNSSNSSGKTFSANMCTNLNCLGCTTKNLSANSSCSSGSRRGSFYEKSTKTTTFITNGQSNGKTESVNGNNVHIVTSGSTCLVIEPASTTCCANIANITSNGIHRNGSANNVTFSDPPVSPYLKRNSSSPTVNGFGNNGINTTDSIVVVKFEKKGSLRKSKNKCTIMMNSANLEVSNGNSQTAQQTPQYILPPTNNGNGINTSPVPYSCNFCKSQLVSHVCDGHVNSPGICNGHEFSYETNGRNTNIPPPTPSGRCRCDKHEEGDRYRARQDSNQPTNKCLRNGGGRKRLRITRSSKYGSALRSRRKIIKMLILLVLAFAICNLPQHVRKMWQYTSNYDGASTFSTLITPITFLILYSNSAINCVLYAFLSHKFRASFRDLLCCNLKGSLRMTRNASVRSTHFVQLSTATG